jgi:hypothetical protein
MVQGAKSVSGVTTSDSRAARNSRAWPAPPRPATRGDVRRAAAEEQTLTAVHESGHAVVARAIGHGVVSVSLDGARTRYRRGEPHAHLCEAMVALAGPLAEQHYRPTTPAEREALRRDQWRSDLDHARHHVAGCGAAGQWVGRQVRALVRRHWSAIVRVAEALAQRGTLSNEPLQARRGGHGLRALRKRTVASIRAAM